MWSIRAADPGDAAEIASLYVLTRQTAYSRFFPIPVLEAMSVHEETARWAARIGSDNSETIVGTESGGRIAGFTHASWHDPARRKCGEVEYMYVATDVQGRGLGAKLIAEAESAIASAAMDCATLWVYEGNAAAQGFYERCGWAHDGAYRSSESAPGQSLMRYRRHVR